LEVRDLFDRHPHAEVTARDHDRVRDRDDLIQVLDAFTVSILPSS